jgi:hypothetical protein
VTLLVETEIEIPRQCAEYLNISGRKARRSEAAEKVLALKGRGFSRAVNSINSLRL